MCKRTKMKNSAFLILFASIGLSKGLLAQENQAIIEMITDRPDATESPNTVPKGYFQIETGAFYESFDENNFKAEVFGYNTTLLRYGIFDNFEIRLGWNIEEGHFSSNGHKIQNRLSGLSPLLAGMKVEIIEENGWQPEIGLLGHLYLPFTASTDYKPDNTGVDIILSFAHTLSEHSSLAYNLGAQWLNDSPMAEYIYTLAYGYRVSSKIGLYAEIYGDLPENNKANHLWDAGFTYSLKNNLQLDATVGRSFTSGQDILLSLGMSLRIPN